VVASVDDAAGSSTDAEIVIQQGHLAEVSAVAFVMNGRELVSSSFDGTVRVWNVQNHKLERILHVANPVLSPPLIATSPDGKLLAAKIIDEEIGIWELSSWTKVSACKHQYVRFFKFSPDSSTLAGTAGTKIFLCDVYGAAA
jgi:WD40 repeat protein